MTHPLAPTLPARRAVLAISGADRTTFLQGLVTNDVKALSPDRPALWSALLTPQGRWLSTFFLYANEERILLDCAEDHADMLVRRLSRFKLRSDVRIEPTEFHVQTGDDTHSPCSHAIATAADPRCAGAGWRAITPEDTVVESPAEYLRRRLSLGLPDHEDFVSEQTLALEANMDLLHGVSWTKGCYLGQELTARTHYRGLLKKRLLPLKLQSGEFDADTATITLDGRDVGEIRSHLDNRALAVLRRDAWAADRLLYDGRPVAIDWPVWFPEEMRA